MAEENTLENLLNKVKNYDRHADLEMIQLAYDFANTLTKANFENPGNPILYTHLLRRTYSLT